MTTRTSAESSQAVAGTIASEASGRQDVLLGLHCFWIQDTDDDTTNDRGRSSDTSSLDDAQIMLGAMPPVKAKSSSEGKTCNHVLLLCKWWTPSFPTPLNVTMTHPFTRGVVLVAHASHALRVVRYLDPVSIAHCFQVERQRQVPPHSHLPSRLL